MKYSFLYILDRSLTGFGSLYLYIAKSGRMVEEREGGREKTVKATGQKLETRCRST